MGLFEAKGQIDRAAKEMMIRWSICRSQWRDNVAAEFEDQQLAPIQQSVKNATGAMNTVADLIARIKADVSDRA